MANGANDDQGVYIYGEDDDASPVSDLLNLGQRSNSQQFAADRARLTNVEAFLASGVQRMDSVVTKGRMLVQSGIVKVRGSGGAYLSAPIVFPTLFSTPPVTIGSVLGYRSAGAFNLDGLTLAGESADAEQPTATGCVLYLRTAAGTLSASFDWYLSWFAIGPA